MIIDLEERQAFGLSRLYPANDEARTLAEIAGSATLTERTLSLASQLGADVRLVAIAGRKLPSPMPFGAETQS